MKSAIVILKEHIKPHWMFGGDSEKALLAAVEEYANQFKPGVSSSLGIPPIVFYLDEFRALLKRYESKEISFSRLVEIMNEKATGVSAMDRLKSKYNNHDNYKNASEIIPPITHELGKHWEQPNLDGILISDNFALFKNQSDIKKLSEYSTSNPSGVYEGKMWLAIDTSKVLLLSWYGVGEQPNVCTINRRQIILANQ